LRRLWSESSRHDGRCGPRGQLGSRLVRGRGLALGLLGRGLWVRRHLRLFNRRLWNGASRDCVRVLIGIKRRGRFMHFFLEPLQRLAQSLSNLREPSGPEDDEDDGQDDDQF